MSVAAPHYSGCIPLSELGEGTQAVVAATDVDPSDAMLLSAMGLRAASCIRLSQAGEPCIVQVNGTRIGLNARLARGIHVRVQ